MKEVQLLQTVGAVTGVYGNSLQFWVYDNIGCTTGGLCLPRIIFADNGNVGIGTSIIPTAKLHVESGANTDAAVLATSTENNKLIVRSEATNPVNCTTFRLQHEFGTNRNNGAVPAIIISGISINLFCCFSCLYMLTARLATFVSNGKTVIFEKKTFQNIFCSCELPRYNSYSVTAETAKIEYFSVSLKNRLYYFFQKYKKQIKISACKFKTHFKCKNTNIFPLLCYKF